MKGFAKIFEAVVASVILLASLTFFFTPNVEKTGWDSASLQVLAEDALESAYLNGTLARFVKTDDTSQLNSFFSSMLPKTVDFSIAVRGIPGEVIFVSCVDCSGSDLADISAIVNPASITYKMKNTSIRVETLDLGSNDIPGSTNVIFFFDKTKIATYQSKIEQFLEDGGGVVLLSDLSESDLQNTAVSSIFNLTWNGDIPVTGRFDSGIFNSSRPVHYVARYYANISTRHLPNVQSDGFNGFTGARGARAENDGEDIIKDANDNAYIRANEIGSGRTIWIQDYSRADHLCDACGPTRDIDNLTKASIMWVSGERSALDSTTKAPAPVNFKSSIFVHDRDSYIVELTIWRIYF